MAGWEQVLAKHWYSVFYNLNQNAPKSKRSELCNAISSQVGAQASTKTDEVPQSHLEPSFTPQRL